jgi:hypothetical protein
MKKLISIILLASLVGCATTTTGTIHEYATQQNIKIDSDNVQISGDMLTPWTQNEFTGERHWSRHLIISFDNKPVIDGFLSNPRDVSGELSGEYKGKKVSSICSSNNAGNSKLSVDCMILIDNVRTVTLTF